MVAEIWFGSEREEEQIWVMGSKGSFLEKLHMKCLWNIPEVSIWQLDLVQNVSMDFKTIYLCRYKWSIRNEQDKYVEMGWILKVRRKNNLELNAMETLQGRNKDWDEVTERYLGSQVEMVWLNLKSRWFKEEKCGQQYVYVRVLLLDFKLPFGLDN